MDGDHLMNDEVQRAAYWIRTLADERQVTIDQLAVYAGVSRGAIFKIFRGEPPTLRTLAHIAAYLGVRVADLLRPIPEKADG